MTGSDRILFDACTLENFVVVGRLDLLQTLYEGKCGWTDGIEMDIRRGLAERPHLQPLIGAAWLGTPIAADDPLAVQRIDRIRRGLGGSPGLPMQHLGEAQTIYHLGAVEPTAIFATDDRDAYNTAQRRGIHVIDTSEILGKCYEAAMLGCPDAYELLHKMAAAGRGVAVPPSHWYICPPVAPER